MHALHMLSIHQFINGTICQTPRNQIREHHGFRSQYSLLNIDMYNVNFDSSEKTSLLQFPSAVQFVTRLHVDAVVPM